MLQNDNVFRIINFETVAIFVSGNSNMLTLSLMVAPKILFCGEAYEQNNTKNWSYVYEVFICGGSQITVK